jgi:AAHS family 4-hydroxybenzoate transporter-like MFS transporter
VVSSISTAPVSPPPTLDVEDVINANAFNGFQLRLLLISSLALLVEGFDYQSMALVIPVIGNDWAVPAASFGPVLASLSAGQALGGIAIGAASDRWGRRPTILASFALIAAVSFATSAASGIASLAVWRFLTGFGISGVAVTTYALVIDNVPVRRRALCIALLFSFFSLGGFLMGFVAPIVIQLAGWRGIFIFGGIAPIPIILVMYRWLPESIKVLMKIKRTSAAARTLLHQLGVRESVERLMLAPAVGRDGSPTTLLSPPYRYKTLSWWGIYFTNAFVFYGLVSWLPTLLANMTFTPSAAQRISSMIWAGTFVGGLLLSALIDSARSKAVPLLAALSLAAVALLMPQLVSADPWSWSVLLLCLGFGIGSIQLIIPALGALIYPPTMLGKGLGMGGVISRIGHIIVPLLGGLAISHGANTATILGWLLIPVGLTILFTISFFVSLSPRST